jgi:hypothetical protein
MSSTYVDKYCSNHPSADGSDEGWNAVVKPERAEVTGDNTGAPQKIAKIRQPIAKDFEGAR